MRATVLGASAVLLVLAAGPAEATPGAHGGNDLGDAAAATASPGDVAHDGAAHDEAGHDGAAHDSAAHDEAGHDGAAHEDGAHDEVDHDGGGHGQGADDVSASTRVAVVGGFGAVNAAAVGTAFVLRRRDRSRGSHARPTRRSRG